MREIRFIEEYPRSKTIAAGHLTKRMYEKATNLWQEWERGEQRCLET